MAQNVRLKSYNTIDFSPSVSQVHRITEIHFLLTSDIQISTNALITFVLICFTECFTEQELATFLF